MLLMAVSLWLGMEVIGGAEEFVYKKNKRDPFLPLVTEDGKLLQAFGAVALEDVYLEGIIWDPRGDSIAIINGAIVKQGEALDDFKILKIEKDQVVLQTEEGNHFLKLEKDSDE